MSEHVTPKLINAGADAVDEMLEGKLAAQRAMVDAWAPAARAAGEGASFADIRAAAEAGAEATKEMIATKGRTSRLGERALGHIDPGAASAAFVIEALTKHWECLP